MVIPVRIRVGSPPCIGLMAMTPACHVGDSGSIPGYTANFFGGFMFDDDRVDPISNRITELEEFIKYVRDAMHLAVSPELRIIADQVLKGDYSWTDE